MSLYPKPIRFFSALARKRYYHVFFLRMSFAVAFSLAILNAAAQGIEQWRLLKILEGNDGGLPQNTCRGLYFDKETGFLWISTQSGIVRYNGSESRVFDKRSLPKIASSRIGEFFTTTDGRVATFNYRDYIIFLEKNKPVVSPISSWFLTHETQTSFANLNLHIPPNDSLYLTVPGETGFSTTAHDFTDKIFWINDSCRFMAVQGNFMIATTNSILRKWQVPSWQKIHVIQSGNKIFILSDKGNAYTLDVTTLTLKTTATEAAFKKGGKIFSDIHAGIPMLLLGKELYQVSCRKDSVTAIPLAQLPDLPQDITSIALNPNGRQIYCGSITRGVYIYSKSFFYTYKINRAEKEFKYLNKDELNDTYATILTGNNHVITNTGLQIDVQKMRYNYFPLPIAEKLLMLPMGKGRFIFSSGPDLTLREMDINTMKLFTNKKIKNFNNGFVSPSGNTWINTYDYFGLYRGDSIGERFYYINYFPDSTKGRNFRIIGETSGNKLLLADFKKIVFFDLTTKSFIKTSYPPPDLVLDERIKILDGNKYCWIPTYGNGYYLYDLEEDRYYKGPIDTKGFLLYTHAFIPDSLGNFLIPTNNGLFRVNRDQLIKACKTRGEKLLYEYYDHSNGLETNEFNGACIPAYNTLPNGDILLPSIRGLVRVFNSEFPASIRYPLFVESITTKDSVYDHPPGINFKSSERSQTWLINFSQWNSIYTTGLSYRLDEDSNWTYLEPGERKIQLNELTGGNHILHIRNQYTLSDKEIIKLSIPFTVTLRYYENKLFWLFLFILLIVVIVLTSHFRSERLRRKNMLLEEKVEEKTKQVVEKSKLVVEKNFQLEKMVGDLNDVMYSLETKSNFQKKVISLIGHDMIIPLKYINKVSQQLITYRDRLGEGTKAEAISEINNTSAALAYLGDSIVHWIKLQENSFAAEAYHFEFRATILDELLPLHERMAAEKDNIILVNMHKELHCMQDPVILKIILHNLLINANKFTSKGTITIEVNKLDGHLSVKVSDTGVGMPDEIKNNLNQMRAVNSRKGTNKESGWGLGYRLIIELLKTCSGRLRVQSAEEKGSSVEIILPEPFFEEK